MVIITIISMAPGDGVAMGSPIGPLLANIFMCNFEEKWFAYVDSRLSISFKYVDDTFVYSTM